MGEHVKQSQKEHGNRKLLEFAKRHNISEECAIRVLMDIKGIRDFWNWVNADLFLNEKAVDKRLE